MSISMQNIVSVTGSVINAGFNTANLIVNALTENTLVPASSRTLLFSSSAQVGGYFGTTSDEYLFATKYFGGTSSLNTIPTQILYSRYVQTDVGAYTFSPTVPNNTVVKAKALLVTTFVVTIDGVSTELGITPTDLDAVTGLTDIASLIDTAVGAEFTNATCTIIGNNRFIIYADNLATTTIGYCTGTLADVLFLTQGKGATLSQGIVGGDAGLNMTAIVQKNSNWLAVTYVTRLTNDTAIAGYPVTIDLCSWIATQGNSYIGLFWESAPVSSISMYEDLINEGYASILNDKVVLNIPVQLDYNGDNITTNPITNNEVGYYSTFVGGIGASINYASINGKVNFAGKTQNGLLPNVTNDIDYQYLLSKGYNVYGQFSTRAQIYNLSEDGSIGGDYTWIDNIYDWNWLQDQIQNSLALLINKTKRIPYNQTGQATIASVLTNIAQLALRNGVIETGNNFSSIQVQEIIQLVGYDISSILTTAGYFIYQPAITAEQRNDRSAIQVYFIYTNGGAVNKIAVGGVFVQ